MSSDAPVYLLTTDAVRTQCERVTEHIAAGNGHFDIDESKLAECAQIVAATTRRRYPDLDVPFHSRWRHFTRPGWTLDAQLDDLLEGLRPQDKARVGFDLVVPSVLLDAGAGPSWTYHNDDAGNAVGRSEGLGLASLAMFLRREFEHEPATPGTPSSTAHGLIGVTEKSLEKAFQVRKNNPLIGIPGRTHVLNRLGEVLGQRTDIFPNGRLGDLVDLLSPDGGPVRVADLFASIVEVLTPIWPDRTALDGASLGDAWPYTPLGQGARGIVPFHKLSQWLAYSLAETLIRSGIEVSGLESLTPLPEYRNGGLLLESGVLSLRDLGSADWSYRPDSALIIEWRALTVTLIDRLSPLVRAELDRPDMSLAAILEGGTWAAGRELAYANRADGSPPLTLESDGTVF